MKKVWIIWWLWPETTAEFYLDVIFSCQKKNSKVRAPIIISSVPLPYAIEKDLIEKSSWIERFIPYLVKEAKRLEKSWADFLVVPCNSVHVFIEDIRKSVNIPVLSILEETISFLNKNNFKKVWVISTSATIKNNLYENILEKNNIDYLAPDDFYQAQMWKIISNLVNWIHNNNDREQLIKTINDFEDKNLDCVILACTDLQLLIPDHPSLKIFDTMKILSDSTSDMILS